jgi:hypothetical protein
VQTHKLILPCLVFKVCVIIAGESKRVEHIEVFNSGRLLPYLLMLDKSENGRHVRTLQLILPFLVFKVCVIIAGETKRTDQTEVVDSTSFTHNVT